MLTRDEKELLEALKEHMDDEQKEAVDAMGEAELKGLLKEAMKEMETEMSNGNDEGFGEFMRNNCDGGSFLGPALIYLFRKKPGCGCLVVLIAVGLIIYFANR